MRIVACLCWFEEPVGFLDRLIRSLAGHVDALVAVDGAWHGFEGGSSSSWAEVETIMAACEQVEMPLFLEEGVWASQAAKRQAAARIAIAEAEADWVMVVDGDEQLALCNDEQVRQALWLTDLDVVEALERQLNRCYTQFPTMTIPIRHMVRAIPGLEFRHAHNGIVTPDGRWLNGDDAHVQREPALDLSRVLQFDHDNQNRGVERNGKAHDYRKTRAREQLESWRV